MGVLLYEHARGLSSWTTTKKTFRTCYRCRDGRHDEAARVYVVLQLPERISGRPHICMGEDRLSPVTECSSCPSPHFPSSAKKFKKSINIGPNLKFYLFPLSRPTLIKGPTQKNVFQFSVKNIFLNFIAT